MKKLILTSALLFTFFVSAQEVYQNNNLLLPTTIVEKDPVQNTYNVYKVNNGIKDFFPVKTIEKTETEIRVYNVVNGVKEIIPTTVIKLEEKPKSN